MKAVVCEEFGPPEKLVVKEVPDPVPGEGQVLIEVKAAGVNFPDVLVIQDLYQFKPGLPFTPGSEVAGLVKALGSGVKGVKVGDRVLASTPWSGFAELALADASRLIHLPDSVSFEMAGGFWTTYGTSYNALKERAHLKEGQTLLVLGAAGGVGVAAIDIGKAMGARVIAAASSEEKIAVAKQVGADEGIVYPTGELSREQQKAFSDQIKELTGGEGVDVIYDPVGGDYAEPALRAIAWDGTYLVVGFAAGPIPRIPLNLPLLKQCQISGVFYGAFAGRFPEANAKNTAELVGMMAEGRIKPLVTKTYPLEDAAQALTDMMNRKVTGSVVLVTD